MALSYHPPVSFLNNTATTKSRTPTTFSSSSSSSTSVKPTNSSSTGIGFTSTHQLHHNHKLASTTPFGADKWRVSVSFFPAFLNLNKGKKDSSAIKEELLEAIAPLDRGAEASPEDQELVDQITRKLEGVNPTKEPLKTTLLDGKWELIYTTSASILQTQRPKLLRSTTNYQAINVDTLRAQNMESWPFFNQVTADLTPLNLRKVAVKFDVFKILGLIPVKAPGRARGELEITYLDEELRVSRGDKGNLFILKMVDPSYRVPV